MSLPGKTAETLANVIRRLSSDSDGEIIAAMLLTWHNVSYYQALMRGLRAAIAERRLDGFAGAVRAGWAREEPT